MCQETALGGSSGVHARHVHPVKYTRVHEGMRGLVRVHEGWRRYGLFWAQVMPLVGAGEEKGVGPVFR